ncbi:MAG: DNA polymerase III subunit chi [Cardiobacterium sp.]|nr:MAG: DNA polymerase III subunit chi [Cardiobacterium sp.]
MNPPTVRFYVLPAGSGLENRLELACKLAEKAQQERLKTLILCADEHMAAQLDHALWHYRADSFLTHCRPDDPLQAEAAAVLAVPPERVARADVLINLSLENTPDLPRGCSRVLEIVSPQPDVLHSTRARYRAYRERGLDPQTHTLGS